MVIIMNSVSEECLSTNHATTLLTALVDPKVDWDVYLRQQRQLRIVYGVAVVAAEHVCSHCAADMGVVAIRSKKVCVDACYFIQMRDGLALSDFLDLDRVAHSHSTISLPSYAVEIEDIQDGFVEQLLAGMAKIPNAIFHSLKFEKVNGVYGSLCPECGTPADETVFLGNRGGRFHPDCPEAERMTLYPASNAPLILRCGLLPLDDLRSH